MFDIAFTDDIPERQQDGDRSFECLAGRTRLGDDTETFFAPLGHYSRTDYEAQWIEAAHRLLGPHARAGFFTVAFQFWWVMWREADAIFVQEHLLLPEVFATLENSADVPYQLITDRQTHGEDGDPISEWQLTTQNIRDFLDRRK